jgi:hypothetical protein
LIFYDLAFHSLKKILPTNFPTPIPSGNNLSFIVFF